jgi:hypothetical protein
MAQSHRPAAAIDESSARNAWSGALRWPSLQWAAAAAAYLLVSALFTGLYLRMTVGWTESQLLSYTWGTGGYPGHHLLFECRVLVPLVARVGSWLLPVDLSWVFRGIAGLSVLGALDGYRRYLVGFMERRLATFLALTLVYPMLWNFCLLNRIYFPFDLPALLLFILGLHFMRARRWTGYYAVLILGLLNHEAAALLIVVFWLASRDSMALRTRCRHLLLQVAALIAVKCATCLVVGWGASEFGDVCRPGTYLRVNAGVLGDMLAFRANAFRDWAKMIFAFGGLWLALPLVRRHVPRFLAAAVWSGVVYIFFVGCMAIIDEVRGYAVLVPIVLTPVVYVAAKALGGVRSAIPGPASAPPACTSTGSTARGPRGPRRSLW